MEKQVIIFDQTDPKKHSVRYNTSDKSTSAVESIYIKRSHLGLAYPKSIKVTIEESSWKEETNGFQYYSN